jgi:DNA replication protein DnaC
VTTTQAPAASAYQQLRGHLHYLRLDAAAEALPAALEHARAKQLGHTAFLERLLAIEVTATEARRHASRLRFAAFPAPWRLEDFDLDAQPSLDRALVAELATLRFVEEKANVLLIGPPGVGKTHLALALGHLAVDAGYRTCYVTPPTWSPAATAPPWRAAGPPPCAPWPATSC